MLPWIYNFPMLHVLYNSMLLGVPFSNKPTMSIGNSSCLVSLLWWMLRQATLPFSERNVSSYSMRGWRGTTSTRVHCVSNFHVRFPSMNSVFNLCPVTITSSATHWLCTTWQVSAVLTCGNYLAGPREMTVSLPLPVQPSTIIVLCFSTQFTFGKGFWQHDAHPWWHVSQWQSSGVTMNFSLGCYIAMQVSFGIEGMPCACSTASRLEGWGSQIVVCALSFVMWS